MRIKKTTGEKDRLFNVSQQMPHSTQLLINFVFLIVRPKHKSQNDLGLSFCLPI